MALTITLNGEARTLAEFEASTTLDLVIAALGLKADRVAVERNGEIARRAAWNSLMVEEGDKLEVVHFVGGGL
jgi:sulfur carrier protein